MKRSGIKRETPMKRTGFRSSGSELKRTPIKRRSTRNADRANESKPVRDAVIAIHGECWICKTNPNRAYHPIEELNNLCCHEILNGGDRQKVLDEQCALLCLCWNCNGTKVEDKNEYPHARQLAILLMKNPKGYDLERFNWLRNPNAPNFVTQYEVDEWVFPF